MATFESWDAYSTFAESVRKERRFAHSGPCIRFLDAVRATSEKRVKRLPRGYPLWRAQIGHEWEMERPEDGVEFEVPYPYSASRMVPDPSKVNGGRLNPRGIAYLYLADHRDTAIAEVRPWVQASVSIGVFEVLKDLKVVDCSVGHGRFPLFLEAPPESAWPEIVWEAIDNAFSTPTDPEDSVLTYAPTQVLAEVLRDQGYDGIAYKSSLETGMNFALFDPASARLFACDLREVRSVKYTHSESGRSYSVERETQTPTPAKEAGT